MQPQSLVLKLKYGDDVRRMRLDDAHNATFERLEKLARERFVTIPPSAAVMLKYVDEDGDNISVTCDMELREAVNFACSRASSLVFTVHPVSRPKPEKPRTRRCPYARKCNPTPRAATSPTTCTFAAHGRRYVSHDAWFNCMTCGLVGSLGCCAACAQQCHANHTLVRAPRVPIKAYCDCGAGENPIKMPCRCMPSATPANSKKEDAKPRRAESFVLPRVLEDILVQVIDGVLGALPVSGESADAAQPRDNDKGKQKAPADEQVVIETMTEEEDQRETEERKRAEKEAAVLRAREEEAERLRLLMEAELQKKEAEEAQRRQREQEEAEKKRREEAEEEEKRKAAAAAEEEKKKQAAHPFAQKLAQLADMGFTDREASLAALVAHKGDLNAAVATLLL